MSAEPAQLDRQERWMTARELAEYLGVGADTVRKWKERGPNRYVMAGTFRYKESDVIAWIEKCNARYGL